MLGLPLELLELVLGHLDEANFPGPERDAIRSLTLTCSQLRVITQPILFSTVRIGNTAKRDDLRVAEIRSLFQSRPESAQWIRRLYINIYNSQPRPGNMWGTDMTALADNLQIIFLNMTCLQAVEIENTHITAAMHAHLWHLARGSLRELRCREVEVDEILAGTPPTSELAIEVFGVDFPSWKAHVPITEMIHSPRLQRLQLSTTALPSVFQICNVNGRTTPTTLFSRLRYLELPPPYYILDTEEYFSFLACCPEIRTLIISPSYHLPSSFSATLSVTVPQRPRHPPIYQADLATLAKGSAPLEALEFSTDLEEITFSHLADFFPALKGLEITFDVMPSYAELERELELFMPRMHRLQTLNLAGFNERHWDAVESAAELDLITKIHAVGPSLRFVRLPGANYWECRDGLWSTSLSDEEFAKFDVFPSSSL